MSKNSGYIGKRRKISFFPKELGDNPTLAEQNTEVIVGEGKNNTLDVYNARLEDEWPRNTVASITVDANTIYRGTLGNAAIVSWSVVGGKEVDSYGVRAVDKSDNFLSGGSDESTALLHESMQWSVGVKSNTFGLAVPFRKIEPEDVTFKMELYSLTTGATLATTDVITIPGSVVTITPEKTNFDEGESLNITWTTTNVGDDISATRTYLYLNGNPTSSYWNLSTNSSLLGSHDADTMTVTGTWTIRSELNYLDYTGPHTVYFSLKRTTSNRVEVYYQYPLIELTVNKVSTAPTIYSPSGTTSIIEGESTRFGVDFGDQDLSNVGTPSYSIYNVQNTSSSDWSVSTGGNLTVNGSLAYVDITKSLDTSYATKQFYIVYNNRYGRELARSPTYTIDDRTPTITSITENFSSIEEGIQAHQFQFNGQFIADKTLDWQITGAVTADDFSNISSLTGTVAGNGTLQLDTVADETTEGNEDFTLTIRWNGATLISENYTLLDTSLDPPPPSSFNIGSAEIDGFEYRDETEENWWNAPNSECHFTYAGVSNPSVFSGRDCVAFYYTGPKSYPYDSYTGYLFHYDPEFNLFRIDNDSNNRASGYSQSDLFTFSPDGQYVASFDRNNTYARIRIYLADTAWRNRGNQDSGYYSGGEVYVYWRNQYGNTLYPQLRDAQFSKDGDKLIVSGYVNDTVYFWTLNFSTPYDISSITNEYINADLELTYTNGYSSFDYGIGANFEFNRDGTEVTLVENPIGDPSAYLNRYALSTPYDLSTVNFSEIVATLDTSPPDGNYHSNYNKWFMKGFLFDRDKENKLLVFSSRSNNYAGVASYTIDVVEPPPEPTAEFDISTAKLVSRSSGTVSVPGDWYSFSSYAGDSILYEAGGDVGNNAVFWGSATQQDLTALNFDPTYNNISLSNTRVAQGSNSNTRTWYSWEESGNGFYLLYNDTLYRYDGNNYNIFGPGWDSGPNNIGQINLDSTDYHFAVDMHVVESGGGIKVIISALNQWTDRYYFTQWNSMTQNFDWSFSYYRSNANAIWRGKFEFNSGGTEVTMLDLLERSKLITYDISSDPYNLTSVFNSPFAPTVRTKDLGINDQVIDFIFERQYPKTKIYVIDANTINQNTYNWWTDRVNIHTFEMDKEYADNTSNTYSSTASTLNPIAVTYDGSENIAITFSLEDNANKFKLFMEQIVNTSLYYRLAVSTQASIHYFGISGTSGATVSVNGAVVTLGCNVRYYNPDSDTDNLNDINITYENGYGAYSDAVSASDVTGNTASILTDVANDLGYAFAQSGLGINTLMMWDGSEFYTSTDSNLLGGIDYLEGTIAFGFDSNISSGGRAYSSQYNFFSFNLTPEITGTGSVNLVTPSASGGPPIEPYFVYDPMPNTIVVESTSGLDSIASILNAFDNFWNNGGGLQFGSPSIIFAVADGNTEAILEYTYGNSAFILYNPNVAEFNNVNILNLGPDPMNQPGVNLTLLGGQGDQINNMNQILISWNNVWFENDFGYGFFIPYDPAARPFWDELFPRILEGTFSTPQAGFRHTEISNINAQDTGVTWDANVQYENNFYSPFITVKLTQ